MLCTSLSNLAFGRREKIFGVQIVPLMLQGAAKSCKRRQKKYPLHTGTFRHWTYTKNHSHPLTPAPNSVHTAKQKRNWKASGTDHALLGRLDHETSCPTVEATCPTVEATCPTVEATCPTTTKRGCFFHRKQAGAT